jgi:hypothetical protein
MSIQKPDKRIRQIDGRAVQDPVNIVNVNYNEASGGTKALQVGPFLKPIEIGTNSYTTDATTPRSLRKGTMLAIYNNSANLESITLGDTSGIVSLAVGVTDANGNVGIPMRPNDWTYINTYDKQWVVASSSNLKVFIMEDESYISNYKQG